MKDQGVSYVAAVAAAVSLAALGYAVVWGVDPADLGRPAEIAKPVAETPVAPVAPLPRPRPADIVLAPTGGKDARAQTAPSVHAVLASGTVRPAPGVPLDEPGRLAPARQVIATPKGADGRSLPAATPHVTDRAAAVSPRLKPRPLADPLRPPQAAILPQDAPAALSESSPLSAVDPPAEPDRVDGAAPAPSVLPPQAAPSAAPRAVTRPAPRLALPQPAPQVLPPRRALGEVELEPPPGVTIMRGAPPNGLTPPRSSALATPRLATGERAVEPPPGVTVTQGAPAPSAPGPLIIRVPDRPRR